MKQELLQLFKYNIWANERLFSVMGTLSEEQWLQPTPNSFPTLADCVFHMYGAEWLWLRRWQGISLTSVPHRLENSIAYIKKILSDSNQAIKNYLEEIPEEKLVEHIHYTNLAGDSFSVPLHELMRHVINHGTYHRGQVIMMLRSIGGKTISTDYVLYVIERNEKLTLSD